MWGRLRLAGRRLRLQTRDYHELDVEGLKKTLSESIESQLLPLVRAYNRASEWPKALATLERSLDFA